MGNTVASTCKVLEDLPSCLNAPSHCVPTVQYRLLNLDLPFDRGQVRLFSQDAINLFASNVSGQDQSGQDFETSDNLIADTFSFTTPFIMMGVCIYAYGEPFGFSIDGNHYGTQAQMEALKVYPGSPLNLRNDSAYLTRLGVDPALALQGGFFRQAQLEWGAATWKAIWAFMNAYRIQVDCPNSSSGEYLINELIADIGNCCSHSIPEGFGTGKTNWIEYVRLVNERLGVIRTGSNGLDPIFSGGADPGYFLPFNCDQHFDATGEGEDSVITPYRQPVDISSFGREFINPTIEQWYRMTCPIPMDKDTKIRINLYKSTGNQAYLNRFLYETTMQPNLSPIPGNDHDVNLHESSVTPTITTHEPSTFTRIPGGKIRIGIGLKGFFVKPRVCSDLQSVLTANGNLGGCGTANNIMGGQCQIQSVDSANRCMGPIGQGG